MIEQIVRSKAPIQFDTVTVTGAFATWHIPTPIVKDDPAFPSQGGVTVVFTDQDDNPQDKKDAVQKLTDELFKPPYKWWIPEILPLSYTYQTPEHKWKTTWW
jgi:hypothetical protein